MDPLSLALAALAMLAFVVIAFSVSKYRKAEQQAQERARLFQLQLLEKAKAVDENS